MVNWMRRSGAGLLAAGLIAAPLSVDLVGFSVSPHEALARGAGGSGAGGGGGPGGGAGSGGRGGSGGSSGVSGGVGYGSAGPETGHEAREAALSAARERYNEALGATAAMAPQAAAGLGHEFGFDTAEAAFVFSDEDAGAVIEAGWVAPQARTDPAFANHGQKVRTYVAIARALGHSAHVGALQANFGTDKPGQGPEDGWEEVDLDVNGDGVVDEADLELATQQQSAS